LKILSADFIKGVVDYKNIPEDDLVHIAFAGRSNVGKSSLQNALLGRKKLVRVSATPGKTQEINFYLINRAFYFVDLPGIGFAKMPGNLRKKISYLIADYTSKTPNLKGIVYLVDLRTTGTEIDIQAIENLRATGVPLLIIATKKDKLNQKEQRDAARKIKEKFELDQDPICISSLKKTGLDELWIHLLEVIAVDS
jgi:GTP-binding protein